MDISITRPKQFADKIRAYKLYIDDIQVAEIKSGKTITISIPQDAKKLYASVDWCSSNEFDLFTIKPGVSLEVKNSFSHKLWIPFLPLYYITLGNKKYLKIQFQNTIDS